MPSLREMQHPAVVTACCSDASDGALCIQAIYSAHLKLHPLIVLTVLVVAEHSLGVWGLLLAGIFPGDI